jgi:hypothetical protein
MLNMAQTNLGPRITAPVARVNIFRGGLKWSKPDDRGFGVDEGDSQHEIVGPASCLSGAVRHSVTAECSCKTREAPRQHEMACQKGHLWGCRRGAASLGRRPKPSATAPIERLAGAK